MAVYAGSRYANSDTYLDVENGIVFIDPLRLPEYEAEQDDMEILITEGQRLDILAYELYGDAQLEWVLMDANPQLTSPLDLKAGDVITAPDPDRVIGNA